MSLRRKLSASSLQSKEGMEEYQSQSLAEYVDCIADTHFTGDERYLSVLREIIEMRQHCRKEEKGGKMELVKKQME